MLYCSSSNASNTDSVPNACKSSTMCSSRRNFSIYRPKLQWSLKVHTKDLLSCSLWYLSFSGSLSIHHFNLGVVISHDTQHLLGIQHVYLCQKILLHPSSTTIDDSRWKWDTITTFLKFFPSSIPGRLPAARSHLSWISVALFEKSTDHPGA